MPRFEPDPQAIALGEALSALRRAAGLSQAEAGARAGMTGQGWGLYESGRRPGLYRPDVQRRLTAALDATPEALALASGPGPWSGGEAATGVEAKGRAFEAAPSGVRRLQIDNDDLAPWAASGVMIEYQPGRWPRPGQGCVVEGPDGRRRVGLYESGDAGAVSVRFGDGTETLPRVAGLSVSAVTARLEP